MSGAWSDLSRPPLRADALRHALVDGPAPAWCALDVVASTGSTNADVVARARAGEAHGYVLVADHQSAGRGRLARTWTAPPRASVAISVLLRPTAPAHRWGWVPLLTGLAVVDALTRTCGLPAVLKWPNDVLVPVPDGADGADGAVGKVAGILAEGVAGPTPAVVVGTGINTTLTADELPVPTATSLALAGSATTDRDTVVRAYLRALAVRWRAFEDAGGDPRASGLGAGYREACSTVGREVRVDLPDGRALAGLADGVDDDGRLLLRDAAGTTTALAAGDVVHVRPG